MGNLVCRKGSFGPNKSSRERFQVIQAGPLLLLCIFDVTILNSILNEPPPLTPDSMQPNQSNLKTYRYSNVWSVKRHSTHVEEIYVEAKLLRYRLKEPWFLQRPRLGRDSPRLQLFRRRAS